MSGVTVELEVTDPDGCPAAAVSAEAGADVRSVERASAPNAAGEIVEEFALDGEREVTHPEVTAAMTAGDRMVYRFARSAEKGCVCDCIERVAGPVSEVRAVDGALHLTFRAASRARIRDAIGALEERFDGVRVRRLRRTDAGAGSATVDVDVGTLTDRQREVLETARELGYFDDSGGANAGEVAAELDICRSTFTEHLRTAQRKVLDDLLDAT